jgi:hypothetical protein
MVQLDGGWLGSFYVITDVIDKESYSNAPCIQPGAAGLVIGRVRPVGSPQKRFFSRSSKGLGAGSCCGYTELAVYAPSQSRPSLYTLRSGLCFLLWGCASRTYPSKAAGPPFAELRRVVWLDWLFCSELLGEQVMSRHSTSHAPSS